MHENYGTPFIPDYETSQLAGPSEIAIEGEHDASRQFTEEEIDTSVVTAAEDRTDVADTDELAALQPPLDASAAKAPELAEDETTLAPAEPPAEVETALFSDDSGLAINELDGGTRVFEAPPAKEEAGALDTPIEEGANLEAIQPETQEVDGGDEPQRARAILAVAERVTEDYFEEQGSPFVLDRNGLFVPARAENVLTCFRAANVRPGDVSLDIGSGDGRWAVIAGGLLGLEAYGYESSQTRHELAQDALQKITDENLLTAEEAGHVHLVNCNFFDADISNVDVFSYYHGSGPDWRYIEDKLLEEGKPGARLILYGDLVNRETPLEYVRTVPIWPSTNIYLIPDMRG